MRLLNLKYKVRLFKNHLKNHGLIKAFKYTFGPYYIMGADKTPTESERLSNMVAADYRRNPDCWKIVIREGQILLEPRWDWEQEEMWDRKTHTLAYYIFCYGGIDYIAGLDYEPAESDSQ